MKTDIGVDDALLLEVMDLSGLTTRKAAVEEALKFYARNRRLRRALDELRGLGWEVILTPCARTTAFQRPHDCRGQFGVDRLAPGRTLGRASWRRRIGRKTS